MNKKVLTVCAALVLAGSWSTLDAKVLKVELPTIGNAYLLGSGITANSEGLTNALTNDATDASWGEVASVTAETDTWTLTEVEGGFYLDSSDNYRVCIQDNASKSGELKLVAKADATGEKGADNRPVVFELKNGRIVVSASWESENNEIAGYELTYESSALKAVEEATTHFDFALYYATDAIYSKLPGLENVGVVEQDGKGIVNKETLPSDANVAAPLNIQLANDSYLVVKTNNDGDYVLEATTGDDAIDALNASNSLNASWEWQAGKLVSTASLRCGDPTKVVALKYDAAETMPYDVVAVSEATNFAEDNTGIARTTISVSATSIQAAEEINVTADGIIVNGDKLAKLNSVSSDYVIVTLTDGETTYYLKDDGEGNVSAETSFDAENYKQYLWDVDGDPSGTVVNYTFKNLASEKNWGNGSYATFVGAGDVSGLTLTLNGQAVGISGGSLSTDGTATTKAIVSFYEAPTAAFTQSELDDVLDHGFGLTIKISENDTKTIKGVEVFGKTLYPVTSTDPEANINGSATSVLIVDEIDENGKPTSKSNYLVLDKKGWGAISADGKLNGEFIWVSAKDLVDSEKNANWLSYFQFRYPAGKVDTDIVETLAVMNGATGNDEFANAYILSLDGNNYLTTNDAIEGTETWPYIKLAPQNVVDVKTLLGKYWNITFAEKNVSDDEEYKLNGVVAVVNYGQGEGDEADYVKESSVLLTSPETQWAVVAANASNNSFTLQNRENSNITIPNVVLRYDEATKIYTVSASGTNLDGDQVKLASHSITGTRHMDGFMDAKPGELRNQVFHIGQYHYETGNSTAFWTENHQANRSHQLGVTADEENAVDWKLSIQMQEEDGVETAKADTVYVITKLAALNSNGGIDNYKTADTLAILPYRIQNNGNLEYVIFNDNNNQMYYQCQEDESKVEEALRFAFKLKPDSTYNIVSLDQSDATEDLAWNYLTNDEPAVAKDKKVYVANSEQWGSVKQMSIYAPDNNSLMQVLPVDRPEYRQIELVWGDTIKLWRNENESQVVYEKRDDKSVVEGDTLSFLNIDNDNQFNMNPAIFADTAYINRWDADGVKNTCYQYLLAVDVTNRSEYYCPLTPEHNTEAWREANGGPCPDAEKSAYVEGRFLVNLIDTANVYGLEHLHNNPYINLTEEGNYCAKLSFVPGKHMGDSLVIYRDEAMTDVIDTLYLGTEDFNVAKFAFKYVDNEEGSFKIQTQWKEYLGNNTSMTDTEDFADHYEDYVTNGSISNEGYLRFVNGCLVVDRTFQKGDVFNMTERYTAQAPTANESITAEGAVSVTATDGAVVIKGAEGKNVVIATILGKVVANETINSDNETIAVPAGIAVVSVDGESFKVVVK